MGYFYHDTSVHPDQARSLDWRRSFAGRIATAYAGWSIRLWRVDSTQRGGRIMADRQGFEPWIPCGIHAFQACAFSHSAICPLERGATF
jgi:hypothetical protein